MSNPKITVIIPTRQRGDVLEKALRTVMAQDYDNLEIIVSDNYSSDATEAIVRGAKDKRITYINTGTRISMSHNWEFALSRVSEGWVTILGDDDALLPSALSKISAIISSTDAHAIASDTCRYCWPGVNQHTYGRLNVPLRSGYEQRLSRTWVERALNAEVAYNQLPQIYTGGFVSFNVIKQIKQEHGVFFRSINPDIYSAMVVGSTIDRYIFSYEPFAISGLSKHSNGTSYFGGSTHTDRSPSKIFLSESNIALHRAIPLSADGTYPLSVHSYVYEAFLQAVDPTAAKQQTSPEHQLELILATAGRHKAAVYEWGQVYGKLHGLDYAAIESRARGRNFMLRLKLTPRHLWDVLNGYSLGSVGFPIKDVYQASLVAAAIRQISPSKLMNIRRLLPRAAEEWSKRRRNRY
jgi:glycosyltransferase involved in cell wall biosynthesis